MNAPRTSLMRFAVGTVGALAIFASLAPAAFAQEGPYGSTTTTTATPRTATIELTADSGPRGSVVGVSACGYAPAATGGSVTFDGDVVAAGLVANARGCLTRAGGATTGAPLTIRVPADARSGSRNVCTVLAGYNTPCARFQVTNTQGGDKQRGGNNTGASNQGNTQVEGVILTKWPGGTPSFGLLAAIAATVGFGGWLLLAARRRRQTTAPAK